eukprot:Phypoly_transcript_16710.p1 GENE.Phypoly_transcript_16710~~Phypoly_transcript_16710.p1  ORF type:complete len:226 (+),score=66.99 Phypoly_transcript_16710:114-791(+)
MNQAGEDPKESNPAKMEPDGDDDNSDNNNNNNNNNNSNNNQNNKKNKYKNDNNHNIKSDDAAEEGQDDDAPHDVGKQKKKRRRAWKPYSRLNWEEKKRIEEDEEKKAVLKELTKPQINVPKRMKKGMSFHDYRPEAPRITTSDWMSVHEKDKEVNDPTNLPKSGGEVEVLEGLDDQFGTMDSLLEQENQKQKMDRLIKENTTLKARVAKLEKDLLALQSANTNTS